ncbi:hypothetical protein [Micromonospora chokoriensis]
MNTYKVIGICTVAGAKRGETVELDPEQINIQALIEGGHIEPIAVKPPRKKEALQ